MIHIRPTDTEGARAVKSSMLANLEAEFAAAAPRSPTGDLPWRGQVTAVDGCCVQMENPGVQAVNPLDHKVHRKGGGFYLLLMAAADARKRIIYHDISTAAKSHDSYAWRQTSLYRNLNAGGLPKDYFFGGDAAFLSLPRFVTPLRGPGTDNYNFVQSSVRMPIEQAFGSLHMRWPILWRPLKCRFDRRAKLVSALIYLNNRLIDKQGTETTGMSQARIAFNHKIVHGIEYWEIAPNLWRRVPAWDRFGCPVYHHINRASDVVAPDVMPTLSNHTVMAKLKAAVDESGIVRPRKVMQTAHSLLG
jgi:hypothetical protein